MAILKRVRANVYVEGQSVTEYNPIEDLQVDGGGNEITKYIESQEGQEFYIEAGPLDTATGYINSTGLTVECFVDGACVSYTFAEPGHSTKCRGCEYMKEGVKYLQRFEFSKIRTTEGCPNDPKKLQSLADLASMLGTITIRIRRAVRISRSDEARSDHVLKATGILPEKALKGSTVSHSAGLLRDPEVTRIRGKVGCDYIDSYDQPYAIIHFKYRSRQALQIEGIIPRDPSPPPDAMNTAQGLLAEYSSDELRRILQEREGTGMTSMKHEDQKRSTTLPRNPGIKREADPDVEVVAENSRRNKRARHEVIDLSDD